MIGHTTKFSTKFSALVLGGVMAVALTSGANAAINDETFCKAIGIAPELRLDCAGQMAAAASPDMKDQVAAAWVAKSPLASNSPSSLYKPPVDGNAKNGTPGTPYQDKTSVPNEVSAQIHRAMKINNLE
jgi:hypothetical protein